MIGLGDGFLGLEILVRSERSGVLTTFEAAQKVPTKWQSLSPNTRIKQLKQNQEDS